MFNDNGTYTVESAAVCRPPAYQQPPRGTPPPPLDIRRGKLVDRLSRRPVTIRGLNWFGFNVDMGMVDGLWAGGSDAATDFSKIAYQLRMLGFNAVRLPFAHRFLNKTDVWDLVRDCSPVSGTKLKDRLIAPEDANQITLRRTLPPNPAPMRNAPGKCNTYLPARNNQDRLLFVVQQFVALGMYVVLDYQPQGLEQHAYALSEFVTAWGNLWRQVTCLPNFDKDLANRVLVDVMNEPDSMSIRWEASGDRPGAEQLYLATADALWNISPNKLLFMFEGTGQNMFGLNWGNGFITDVDVINSRGLSNPNKFFQSLLKKPYARKSIISPHLYPPTITKSSWLGEALWKQSNTSFGYLQSTGYCLANGWCLKFPVLVGETGSAFTEQDDKTWLIDFADFANARGGARQYNRIPLAGWMWWAYNENSGDTGGIVHNDWQDFNWAKLRYMMDSLGLTPWYEAHDGGSAVGRTPHAPSPVAPTPAPRPPPRHRQPPRAVSGLGSGIGSGRRPRPAADPRGPRSPRGGRTRRVRPHRRRQHRRRSQRARVAAAGIEFATETQL
ncbi:glycoside hydrolase superfamily [Scenedesmus sp. NREL 46B-D3]|nr:glycoside hydrolase superfamily [Scenedesmus sp. NREL 46B-D3]